MSNLCNGDTLITSKGYESTSRKYLSYEKGIVLTVIDVNTNDRSYVICRTNNNEEGLVSIDNCIKREELELHKMKYFFGMISREKSEEILRKCQVGTFLVRESIKFLGDYSLSIRFTEDNTDIQHYRILIKNGKYSADDTNFFDSVIEMIEYYQQDDNGLCCVLKHPLNVDDSMNISSNAYRQTFKKFGWEIPFSQIEQNKEIGKGEFGAVYLATYQNRKVALKSLLDTSAQAKQFLAEISIMTNLKHRNLVELIGISFNKGTFNIVMEYCDLGDLVNYVRCRGRMAVDSAQLLDFSKQICEGMVYIEQKNVVHRDLAARNILLTNDKIAKITDFGLAVSHNEVIKNSKFPMKWTAIEAILHKKYSSKSDVWSYGVLLWEIYSYGKNPYPRRNNDEVLDFIKKGGRMDSPDGTPKCVYDIMIKCWNENPVIRPAFSDIILMLNNIII